MYLVFLITQLNTSITCISIYIYISTLHYKVIMNIIINTHSIIGQRSSIMCSFNLLAIKSSVYMFQSSWDHLVIQQLKTKLHVAVFSYFKTVVSIVVDNSVTYIHLIYYVTYIRHIYYVTYLRKVVEIISEMSVFCNAFFMFN